MPRNQNFSAPRKRNFPWTVGRPRRTYEESEPPVALRRLSSPALGTLVSYQEVAATSEHNETSSGYTESPMLNMIGQDGSVRRSRARCVVPGGDEPSIARWGP